MNKHVSNSKDLSTVLKGAGISLIGKFTNAIIQFVFIVLMTRFLGVNSVGIYFLGYALFQVGFVISSFALNYAASRYLPVVKNPKVFVSQLLQLFFTINLVSLPLLLVLVTTSLYALDQTVYLNIYLLFLLSSVSVAFGTLQVGIFLGMKQIVPSTLVQEILFPSIRLVLFLSLFWAGLRLEAALYAFLLSSTLAAAVGWAWLRHNLSLFSGSGKVSLPTRQELLQFSTPMMLASTINLGVTVGMPVLLSWYASPKEVAFFGSASRIIAIFDLVIIAVSSLFNPTISECLSQGRLVDLNLLYRKLTTFVITLSVPFISLCVLFPKQVMGLFGSEFKDGSDYLTVLAISAVANVSTGSVGQILLMGGHSSILLAITMMSNILAVLVALSVVDTVGPLSFAVGTATGVFCINLLASLAVWYLQKLHLLSRETVFLYFFSWLPVFYIPFRSSDLLATILYVLWTCCVLLIGIFQLKRKTLMSLAFKKL